MYQIFRLNILIPKENTEKNWVNVLKEKFLNLT